MFSRRIMNLRVLFSASGVSSSSSPYLAKGLCRIISGSNYNSGPKQKRWFSNKQQNISYFWCWFCASVQADFTAGRKATRNHLLHTQTRIWPPPPGGSGADALIGRLPKWVKTSRHGPPAACWVTGSSVSAGLQPPFWWGLVAFAGRHAVHRTSERGLQELRDVLPPVSGPPQHGPTSMTSIQPGTLDWPDDYTMDLRPEPPLPWSPLQTS